MAAGTVKCRSVWLLLLPLMWLCVRLSETQTSRPSMEDDVLLPYAHGHGPSRSHRQVRECQYVAHGNTTHETWPSSNHGGLPVAESSVFVSDVPGRSTWVYGHMTVVHDPLRSLSVLEPGGPGGCGMKKLASVEETAEAAGCLYAQNAGFFNTSSHQCLGNVVSDGRLVQDSGGVQNAQFGIRKDGTLVFGYLSQEDVLDQSNPFVQLVSGVMWLLRNGEVYINRSLEAECDKTQETGKLNFFADVVSARTAVGHDAEGRLILFQIDGQTGTRGMNLWQVAEFLKKNGVINAINLDGGGSSTFVTDVTRTTGGAAPAVSPPSCASTRGVASRRTAADTETVWTDAVVVGTVGMETHATLWCVSRQHAAHTESAHPMAAPVMLDGEERTVAKSALPVSTATAAIRPAPASTAAPATTSTAAARALPVSTATPVNKRVLWGFSACPVLKSVAVTTSAHVTL
ncbi:N-acetylglucosamine-1-phosphodiester alpha-N-acetylglucosaminidase [Scomber scombrus]|uniref:N-acetylglucosamine-1-phosphodiester alpha-N-acetylglucosaminidase n=1 Tax=Scomber scombrus TaxID=13677 RepID=A0AAV1QFS8_SCOSC